MSAMRLTAQTAQASMSVELVLILMDQATKAATTTRWKLMATLVAPKQVSLTEKP